jgi:hypothetical protein
VVYPDHCKLAPATIGSCIPKVYTNANGKTISSITANTKIKAETITGTIGLALVAQTYNSYLNEPF